MALVVKDRVKETTTTTGTGTVTLAGAVSGFQSFSIIGNANTTYYTISDGTNWEVGLGTYTSSGTTLSRDTVLESSNSNALVNFPAGTKDVFVTYPAERAIYGDASSYVAFVDGAAATPSIYHSGDSDTGLWFPAANTIAISTNGTEKVRIQSSGGVSIGVTTDFGAGTLHASGSVLALGGDTYPALIIEQYAPISKSASATLTVAELETALINTPGLNTKTLTLPTGTALDSTLFGGALPNLASFDWSVINTGTSIVTIATNTGQLITGATTIAASSSGRFRTTKTSTNNFTTYRIT
jgi:hypothetical protein